MSLVRSLLRIETIPAGVTRIRVTCAMDAGNKRVKARVELCDASGVSLDTTIIRVGRTGWSRLVYPALRDFALHRQLPYEVREVRALFETDASASVAPSLPDRA